MKLFQKGLLAAACASTLLFTGNAFASDTGTLDIMGDVIGECKFGQTAHYVMDFGNLHPSATTDATADTIITYRCTLGQAPSLFTIGGNGTGSVSEPIADGNGHTLAAALTWTTPTTQGLGFVGAGSLINVPVHGVIAASEINAAPAGHYQNLTVALVINP